ncbi:GERMIN-LIKE PROTEIN SUBFAMILY 3 MEMBER 3 [Salix koriyanagi]|uniref:GERMIN-LIKE PROTEIN SUBFAMILY 3 MEMBER 3 n=1 Tax=Salix koriyanagi TaxID=2511006 RepID=A0A9Q0TEJ3_9ROSI|nr:GERMIN-LIKE PROTEIN SUBFAMILY 3 MEMBER 3 [Salix koriyanagi]
MAAIATYLVIFAVISSALAYDPDMLQDLCVANTSAGIKVNGFTCKAETNITEADFFFDGLAKTGKVNNSVGSLVTGANVEKIPGLNTLGVSLSRIDYAPEGLNPPHTHPRATEMIFVLEGEIFVFPRVPDNVLTKAFQIGTKEIDKIKTKLAPKKS